MNEASDRPYLAPYFRAASRYGAGFDALRWTSVQDQYVRFEAMTRLCEFEGKSVLDAGCGRADFLNYLLSRNLKPSHYIGLEAVSELAQVAGEKCHPPFSRIIKADFLREFSHFYADADMIVFSGSLNTFKDRSFFTSIRTAWEAATTGVVLNYLSSPRLASAPWLVWHRQQDVVEFARTLSRHVETLDDYLAGDSTLALWKPVGTDHRAT